VNGRTEGKAGLARLSIREQASFKPEAGDEKGIHLQLSGTPFSLAKKKAGQKF
jgi:hypothetical protein